LFSTVQFEPITEHLTGSQTIRLPGAAALGFDVETGWEVLQEDATCRLVDLLASWPGSLDEFLNEINLLNAEAFHPSGQGF
jgi:hypothetical protein